MERTPRILLVSSVDDDRAQLRYLLEPLKIEITEVSSGLEAVEALQSTAIDLIVTAIAIGKFDSWRLARFVRSGVSQGGRLIPIIIVTRVWCERITEITAQDFGINQLLSFEDRHLLPNAVRACLDSPAQGLGKRRVLVIEDHDDNAQLVKKILRPRFEVELAADGDSGLAAWKKGRHDLVLLDIMLPGISGGTVLNQIMKIDPEQAVVVMTAHGTIDLARELMLAGAVDFVTKPFRADELRRVCELATRREDYLVSNAQVAERIEDLQQLRNLLGNIVDSMPSMLIGVDEKGVVNLWNRGAERLSKVSADFAQGQPLEKAWPDFGEMQELRASLLQGEIRKLTKVPLNQGDNNYFCDITIYPLFEKTVIGAVIRIDDITERVLLEEHIIQTEKMVSMGKLTTGLAHEINNPLAGVLQNVQVLQQRLAENSPVNKSAADAAGIEITSLNDYLQRREIPALLDSVLQSGRRAVHLIENMLNFGRSETASIAPSDMAEMIDRAVELAAAHYSLQRKFDFRLIEIRRDYAPNLPLVECNPMQIQQVILNLLVNGAQAMEAKLQQLRAAGESVDYRPRFMLRTSLVNRRVRIDIEDNGPGMDDATKNRIFESFYTTKRSAEGVGLGLSICYFIVSEGHRGRMTVETELGAGTRFILEFPQKAKL